MEPVLQKNEPKKFMTLLQRSGYYAAVIGLVAANAAYAQINAINSAVVQAREYNDVPGSSLSVVANYPTSIRFTDFGVSAPTGFANRHTWRFSSDSTTSYQFQNNEFFQVSMTLTLSSSSISPRKEAGFVLGSSIGGDGQFIVNTDGHEIVAFGGALPFYAFPATFDSGETITLGMNYFLDSNTGLRSIVYSANGVLSPILPFTNLEQGIIDNSTLGGYLQIQNASGDPFNSGIANFQDISIVPEPSTFALVGMGMFGLLAFRRKR